MNENEYSSCCVLLVGILGTIAVSETRAETVPGTHCSKKRSRDCEPSTIGTSFAPRRFRADWLPDSSGYTVLESAPDGKEQVLVRYDAASGKRTVLDSPQKEMSGRSGNVSPDGQSVLFSEQGNLYVRDLNSDRKIRLTNSAADSAVSNGSGSLEPRWKVDRLRAIGRIRSETQVGPCSGRPDVSESQGSPICQGGRGHTDAACRCCRRPGKRDSLALRFPFRQRVSTWGRSSGPEIRMNC